MNRSLLTIKDYAKGFLEQLDPAFGMIHMETTLRLATRVAEVEAANEEWAAIAAIVHDISLAFTFDLEHETVAVNHGTRSAATAKGFLAQQGLGDPALAEIGTAVATHCFPFIQRTVTAKILWDADKLNLFTHEMREVYEGYWFKQGFSTNEIAQKIKAYQSFYLTTFQTATGRSLAKQVLQTGESLRVFEGTIFKEA